jgi:hypothetical protein
MRIEIDFDKEKTIQCLQTLLKNMICFLYGWFTTDGEILGYILGIWHIIICITIFICVLLSHTFFPNVWFQFGCFVCLFFIWLQHILLHVCVVFVAEIDFTKKNPPFYTLVKNITGIRLEEYQVTFLLVETTAICCLFLELLGKFSLFLFECYNTNNNAFAVC